MTYKDNITELCVYLGNNIPMPTIPPKNTCKTTQPKLSQLNIPTSKRKSHSASSTTRLARKQRRNKNKSLLASPCPRTPTPSDVLYTLNDDLSTIDPDLTLDLPEDPRLNPQFNHHNVNYLRQLEKCISQQSSSIYIYIYISNILLRWFSLLC